MPLLEVQDLEASYDRYSQILFRVSFKIEPGESVALLGRNGMGKLTTVKAIVGLVPQRSGRICFSGRSIIEHAPEVAARLGLGLVPEGRQIFPTLTVRENLIATAANRRSRPHPWTLERVCELFPRVAERLSQRAGTLSGGEQQMLAISRALMTNPQLLVLDEATEGLAPLVRREIRNCLGFLKAEGLAILVIDKNLRALNRLVDRYLIMEKGRIVWSGTPSELMGNPQLLHDSLGV